MLRGKNFDKLNNNENIKIYTGEASFVSADEVQVEMENETLILQGENIFINTGATAVLPKIKGISGNKRVCTSETLMETSKLPKRLAIIGGGYIGLEFASMYSSFGSKVTVFEGGSQLIPREDEDISSDILKVLTEKQIDFKFGAKIEAIIDNDRTGVISYLDSESGENKEHQADIVLIATGRKPNIEDLNLTAAGIEIT